MNSKTSVTSVTAAKTIDSRGATTILIKTVTGHGKLRFNVVLACLVDGTILNLMVIFKRKTLPKAKFPTGLGGPKRMDR